MKILFYSTNSNFYSHGKITLKMIPSCFEQWNNLKLEFMGVTAELLKRKGITVLSEEEIDTLL